MRQRMVRRIQTVCVVVVAVSTTNAASPAEEGAGRRRGGGGVEMGYTGTEWDRLGRYGTQWDGIRQEAGVAVFQAGSLSFVSRVH